MARRRRLLALGLLLVLTVGGVAALSDASDDAGRATGRPRPSAPVVEVQTGGRTLLQLGLDRFMRAGRVQESRLRAVLRRSLPPTSTVLRGRARITYRYDARGTAGRVVAAAGQTGTVKAVREPIASVTSAPVVQQAQRNTCESAALEVLLATTGREVDQGRLQAAFPRSGPLDPTGTGPDQVWGDPDAGYVGRADGGGVAGGFGVYPGPVRETAARFGVRLQDLSGGSAQEV